MQYRQIITQSRLLLVSFILLRHHLQLEFGLWELDLGRSRVVDEPDELTLSRPYTRSGEALIWAVQDGTKRVHLPSAGRNERDARRVVDHRERERDTAGRRLGRVFDVRDPAILL